MTKAVTCESFKGEYEAVFTFDMFSTKTFI